MVVDTASVSKKTLSELIRKWDKNIYRKIFIFQNTNHLVSNVQPTTNSGYRTDAHTQLSMNNSHPIFHKYSEVVENWFVKKM